MQISRGKFDRLHRTPAGFTAQTFDGHGLHCLLPTRPICTASNPISVRQVAVLLHASFRPRLTATPLRFANPSPPSGWIEDLHLQTVKHARHTTGGQAFLPVFSDQTSQTGMSGLLIYSVRDITAANRGRMLSLCAGRPKSACNSAGHGRFSAFGRRRFAVLTSTAWATF